MKEKKGLIKTLSIRMLNVLKKMITSTYLTFSLKKALQLVMMIGFES